MKTPDGKKNTWCVTCSTPDGDIAATCRLFLPAEQLARLRHGLSLDGEPLKPAQVEWQTPSNCALCDQARSADSPLCEQVGPKVVGLKRIRWEKSPWATCLWANGAIWAHERVLIMSNSRPPVQAVISNRLTCGLWRNWVTRPRWA